MYHNDTENPIKIDTIFLLMVYRLLTYVMTPALLITYILGFILLYENAYFFNEMYF